MPKLEGKVAVVTGGSSGIGLATAKRFVEEGAFVYITGRRLAELDKAVSEIGRNVTAIQGDVSNLTDLDWLYAKVGEEKGKFDILFAGAGIVDPQPLAETTEERFDRVFAINTRGLAFTVKKALPLLNDGGAITSAATMRIFSSAEYCLRVARQMLFTGRSDGELAFLDFSLISVPSG